jgi:hypothetical protein
MNGADALLVPFCHQGAMYQVLIPVVEDGEYVRFYIPWLLNIAMAPHRESVLARLLVANRVMKIVKFGLDDSDGEVTASVEIPLEDGTLTASQSQRCMFMLTHVAMRERDNLMALINTGVYPDSSDPEFNDMIDRLLGEQEDESPDLEDDQTDP